MRNFSFLALRVFILILVSLSITTRSIAMVTEIPMNNMPAMSTHCAEMMGDVHASSPEFKSHVDQNKNSCGNHYACFGLELKSANLTMIELRVELTEIQALSVYIRKFNDGYFALPDPPPRYTL